MTIGPEASYPTRDSVEEGYLPLEEVGVSEAASEDTQGASEEPPREGIAKVEQPQTDEMVEEFWPK